MSHREVTEVTGSRNAGDYSGLGKRSPGRGIGSGHERHSKRGNMSPTCVEPELDTLVEEEPVRVEEPEPELPGRKQSIRDLLVTIFAGHEGFLGLTPD